MFFHLFDTDLNVRLNGGCSARAEGQLIEGCYLGCGHSLGFNLLKMLKCPMPISENITSPSPPPHPACQPPNPKCRPNLLESQMQAVATNQNISPRRTQLMSCRITKCSFYRLHREPSNVGREKLLFYFIKLLVTLATVKMMVESILGHSNVTVLIRGGRGG